MEHEPDLFDKTENGLRSQPNVFKSMLNDSYAQPLYRNQTVAYRPRLSRNSTTVIGGGRGLAVAGGTAALRGHRSSDRLCHDPLVLSDLCGTLKTLSLKHM